MTSTKSKLPIEAVLFDLDGTLADTAPDLAGALNQMRVRRGLAALPLEQLRPLASAGARGMLGAGLNLPPDHPEFEAARTEFLDNYASALAVDSRVFEGVMDLLADIEGMGLRWGVVTNKAARFTGPVLSGLGLGHASVVISGDTTAHAKPHPEPLLEACRRLKIEPAQAWYVGDDLRDIQSACAAGMPCVVAAYGYLGDNPDHAAWGADETIHHPREMLNLLRTAKP